MLALSLSYIGIVYVDQGIYDKALEYISKSLDLYEELCQSSEPNIALQGKRGKANCYINYLATDGFSDQFDGHKKSKFSGARLKKLILENCTKPLSIQKGIFDSEFANWKGNNYQVDDVKVLGIRV
jgi:hypothetical protein